MTDDDRIRQIFGWKDRTHVLRDSLGRVGLLCTSRTVDERGVENFRIVPAAVIRFLE